MLGEPLLLYLSVEEMEMGSMVAQIDQKNGKEHTVYYLSKKLLECKTRYTPLEKTCTALVWVTKRLRHYMLLHPIQLISRMDPIKYLFEKPVLAGRMARWLLLLSEFNITYVNQKSVKGRVVSDHLAAHLVELDSRPMEVLFPDEDLACMEEEECKDWWQLYFDGATNQRGYGARILLITPEDLYLPSAFRLEFPCTNNIAEYEACVIGLEADIALGIKKLKVYGDLSIVICQTQVRWKKKDEMLKPYQELLEGRIKNFEEITFEYLSRVNNKFADALATLASMVECSSNAQIRPFLVDKQCEPAYEESVNALTADGKEWFTPIIDFIR
ncbi:uncharacterized protein LOC122659391 [Telopea speciosissima]|uniref:uncharacterized protein LOC122659391 n=1 Tax=Telopea speciosissima TaxID=54955 RepID=UPI001CC724CE|nr:uncharacterized protein LOC122659391 [Telopea speciosissima]